MKTLFTLILLATLPAFAQLTNSIKVSALPSATTPLTGTEIVPLNQSGATKSATIDQVQAKAVGIANATSNTLVASLATLNGSLVTASNLLALRLGTNTTAITTTSNALQAQIGTNTAAIISTSNSIMANVAGAGYATASALVATNTALTSAINNLAAGLGNTLTNGGALSYSTLTASVLDLGKITNTGIFYYTLDLAAASSQRLVVTNSSSTYQIFYIYLTNAAAGQNVSLLISCQALNSVTPGMTIIATNALIKSYNSAGALNTIINKNKTGLLQFQVFDSSNILYSASAQP